MRCASVLKSILYRKYYRITDGKAEPLDYKDFPTPLSTGAVRLGVLRLRNDHPHHYLADDAEKVTKSILTSLPEGEHLHHQATANITQSSTHHSNIDALQRASVQAQPPGCSLDHCASSGNN